MTTLFVVAMAGLAMAVVAALAFSWFLIRAVFWIVLLPLMLLKAAFGLIFGLVFGAFGLLFGLAVTTVVGVVGLVVMLGLLAIPLLPVLAVAALVWLGVKGTAALASA